MGFQIQSQRDRRSDTASLNCKIWQATNTQGTRRYRFSEPHSTTRCNWRILETFGIVSGNIPRDAMNSMMRPLVLSLGDEKNDDNERKLG